MVPYVLTVNVFLWLGFVSLYSHVTPSSLANVKLHHVDFKMIKKCKDGMIGEFGAHGR